MVRSPPRSVRGRRAVPPSAIVAGCDRTALALFAFATVRLVSADRIIAGAALEPDRAGRPPGRSTAPSSARPAPRSCCRRCWPSTCRSCLPVLGQALFGQNALVYLGLCLTPIGVRPDAAPDSVCGCVRSAITAGGGEPRAARAARPHSGARAVGGAVEAAAALTLAATNTSSRASPRDGASSRFRGRRVRTLSAWGVLGGALLFGLAARCGSSSRRRHRGSIPLPALALMLPYVLTLVVLLLSSGRASAPRCARRALRAR